jgi:hypothetical protein
MNHAHVLHLALERAFLCLLQVFLLARKRKERFTKSFHGHLGTKQINEEETQLVQILESKTVSQFFWRSPVV